MLFLAILVLLAAVLLRWAAWTLHRDLRVQGSSTPRQLGLGSSAAFGLGLLLLLGSCVVTIPAGHVGVQVLFGRVKPIALTEGLQVINPLVAIQEMSVRTETY